jgi:hypothetical protein
MNLNKSIKIVLKILIGIAGSIIFLLLLLCALAQTPAIQNIAREKTVSFLQNKLKTKVEIEKLSIEFPTRIVLRGVCLEDQNQDTLLAGAVLKVNIDFLKLLKNHLQINDIHLQGVSMNVQRTLPDSVFNFDYILKAFSSAPSPANTTTGIKISLDKINLSQIRVFFKDAVTGSAIRVRFDHFETRFQKFDLDKRKFSIPEIKLSGLNASIVRSKPVSKQKSIAKIETHNDLPIKLDLKSGTIDLHKIKINDWRITVGQVAFHDVDLKYDDFNQPALKQGMDYAHLGITGLNLQAETFSYSMDTISGRISQASLKNKDNFVLTALRTRFIYSNTGVILNDLYLETPGTILRNYLQIGYPSLETMAKDPKTIRLKATLVNSKISFKDLLTFVPQLALVDPFKKNPNAIVTIAGNLNGSLGKLNIPDLQITGFGTTRIKASGNITGLPDMNRANFDVTIHEFKSGSVDMNQLLSAGMIPETIRLPEEFTISGKFNGGLNSFVTKLDMKSSYGTAHISAGLHLADQKENQKGNEAFEATMELVDFNMGHLLKQDTLLGRISGHALVTGTGTDPKTMNAQFKVIAASAEVKGYTYKNMVLDGNITNQDLVLTAKMDDRNLQFSLEAKANIEQNYPAVSFTLNIDTLNLQQLKLYDSDLRIHGKMVANFTSTNPDSLIGHLNANHLIVTANGNRYQLDSLNVSATAKNEQKDLSLHSDFLTANLNGNYRLTEIGKTLINEINKYFKIGDGQKTPISKAQDFSFALNVKNHPIVQEFFPLLTNLEPVQVKGSFNSETGGFKFNATTSNTIYSGTTIDSVNLDIYSDEKALNYNLRFGKISTASLTISKSSLNGQAQNNQVTANLSIKDQNDKNKYLLAGLFSVVNSQYRFHFNQKDFLLNYDPWTVAPENVVQFGSKGILVRDLKLSGSGQAVSVNSSPSQVNAPLIVDFSHFKIATLTAFAESKESIANGIINGNIELNNLKSHLVFVSDLVIKDFSFKADTLGDISLKVNNRIANTYAANIIISGKDNDIILDGNYFLRPQNKSSFNFDLDIRKLNLASIESLSMGNLKYASGNMNGKLNISGTTEAPVVRGNLHFNQAAFNIVRINSYYTMVDEKLSFTAEGVHFDNFTLIDTTGNSAMVNGSIYTTNYRDYSFGLDISSKNFKVLNSTQRDNKLFYGEVFLDSDLRIRGNMGSPIVEGRVRVNKGTDLTIVIPQSAPGVVEREGIVEFVKMEVPQSVPDSSPEIDSLNVSTVTGMDISVNVVADSSAVFSIIIDEANGDLLKVQGDAQLTAGIDPSGKVTLTGTFEVTKGTYELSFNFLKKSFVIQNGSLITWQGEPTEAEVDVTAVYVANAAPYDLVESKLDETPANLNRYKQKLPFEVTLNMQGELMKPLLTFDIVLPNRNYSVARDVVDNVQYQLTQLKTQPSELNKQVFALLLLNRFVAENPFVSGTGNNGVESLARSSASKLLSEQINQLAGNLIDGVDLNFDLISSEDYTTGALQNRTDLNVGISKQLINNQLKVSVGSNFELEGISNTNQKASNIAGNVALDYQLSHDGKYMLRAYRKNEYQGIAEGYLIETGIGFIFTLDYTKFKEILARNDKVKKERQQIKKEKQ